MMGGGGRRVFHHKVIQSITWLHDALQRKVIVMNCNTANIMEIFEFAQMTNPYEFIKKINQMGA